MGVWCWVVLCGLLAGIAALCGKIYLLRKSAGEIAARLTEHWATDTNILIDCSSADAQMRLLTRTLNTQLARLREERHRFQQGDMELKNAVTNISHDLRTPLTAIYGYLELLQREEQSETVRRYLGMVANRTDALRQLTEELFQYSILLAVQEPTGEPLSLNQVLEESMVSFYGAMEQRGIHPLCEIPEKRVERTLNRSALSRVFCNIISNALKYSDGDFVVTMTTDGTVTFSNAAEALTSVDAEKLFDRFYTVETARCATGLGLSIAKLLTERMGGTIAAAYQDGRLSITIRFPAVPAPDSPQKTIPTS